VTFALFAVGVLAYSQEVQLTDLGVTLARTQPEESSKAIPIDDAGYGSITVDEPGEYQLKLESKSSVSMRYVVEAEVAVDNAVEMDEATRQMIGGLQFTAAPKLHTVEFAGPETVVLDKLAVATSGTVVRVRLVVKGPEEGAAGSEPDSE